jgi:hypothetical protein
MTRIRSVVLGAAAAAALVALAPPVAAAPHPGAARGVPAVLAIDLPSLLFGDENEPDENETDSSAPARRAPKDTHPRRYRTLLGVPLGLAVILAGLLVLGGLTALVVRWVRRYRAWKRRMAFQMRAGLRRLSDDLEQARRRRRGAGTTRRRR